MEDRIFSKSLFVTDSEREFILNYYILCNDSDGFKSYGVGIEKQNDNAVITESESISELFTGEKKARYVLDRLYNEQIMPRDLIGTLEEMLKQDMQSISSFSH